MKKVAIGLLAATALLVSSVYGSADHDYASAVHILVHEYEGQH
jgi:hypothetical protein